MENPSSSSAEPERQLCVQKEPKALVEKELKIAREAALQVIKNCSKEEALKIFLEGLAPVVTSVKLTWEDSLSSDSDEEY